MTRQEDRRDERCHVIEWYLNDEFEKLGRTGVNRETFVRTFHSDPAEAFTKLADASPERLLEYVRFFTVTIRPGAPEAFWEYVKPDASVRWQTGRVPTDATWIESMGFPQSRSFELTSQIESVCDITKWLSTSAESDLPEPEWEEIRHYCPRGPSTLDPATTKIAVLRQPSCKHPAREYRLLQGSHRLIQACFDGWSDIETFICECL